MPLNLSAIALKSENIHFDIQSISLNFTKITGHKGLDLSNTAVISDDHGYLWVGTQDGLIRLDGYQSKRYMASARKENSLISSFINALAYNKKTQEIWIATTGGLSVFNLRTETFKSYRHAPKKKGSIAHNMVQTILVDSQQRVWIGTKEGLNRYIYETDSFESFNHIQSLSNDSQLQGSPPHSNILSLAEDNQGAIWIGTQSGLARYIGNDKFESFLPFYNDDGTGGLITKIAIDRQNKLWLGSEQKGLYYFDPKSGSVVQYQTQQVGKSLPSNHIRSLMIQENGDLWVGTNSGLSIFNTKEQRFLTITNNTELNGNIVSIYQDDNQVIWIGTWSNGLHLFNPRETQIGRIDLRMLKTPDNVIKSVIAGQGDDFWVTNPKSLYRLNSKKGTIIKYDIKVLNPLSSRAIPFIDRRNNSLYLLTDKIHQFDNTEEIISHELPEELRNVSWYGVTVDKFGRLWMAARNLGLFVLSSDFKEVIHHQTISTAGYVRQIDDNTILAGSLSGTFWIDINTFKTTSHSQSITKGMLHSNVTGYHLSSENKKWLATSGGIHRLSKDDDGGDYYQSWSQENGLPSDVLTGPLEDSQGKLWFGSTDGLIRFDPRNESIEHFDKSLGALPQYYIGQYFLDTDKRLIFQGPSGISVIDEQLLRTNTTQYKVVIDAFWLKDQLQEINNEKRSALNEVIQFTESIILPAENRDFSFGFTTTYMTRVDKVDYFYRLVGFDKKWLLTDSRNRLLKYTNLDPGDYRFEIYALSPTGTKGDVRTINLTVKPLIYETVWFRSLLVGLILLAVLALYQLRMRSIKHYNQKLEVQISNRTKAIRTLTDIAKDISSILNIEELIAHLHSHLIKSLDLSVLALGILDSKNNQIKFESCLENGKTIPLHVREVDSIHDLAGWCVTYRKEILLKQYSDRFSFLEKCEMPVAGEKMETVIYLPISSGNEEMLGCLTVQSDKVDAFSDEDIEFIRTITNYTAIAVANTLGYTNLERANESLENAISSLETNQKELEIARDEARFATKSKSDFLANMSHEIRTPMHGIIGLTKLVQNTQLDSEQKDYLDKMSFTANNLLCIVNDIMDFSKVEAGKIELENIPVSLTELLLNLNALIGTLAKDKGLEFKYFIDPILPVDFWGDPIRLSQVLLNLCSNAIKFTTAGTVSVYVRSGNTDTNENSHSLAFDVVDEGIGINLDVINTLFESFSQAETSTTRKFGGTGLGLAISKNLAHLMKGDITVTSTVGSGSCFTFTAQLKPFEYHTKKHLITKTFNKTYNFLHINTDPSNLFSEKIIKMGDRSTHITNSKDAIQLLKKDSELFDLMIIDWENLDCNPLDLLRTLDELDLMKHTKLMIATELEPLKIKKLTEDYDVQEIIRKPVSIISLYTKLATSLTLKMDHHESLSRLSGVTLLLVEDNKINQLIAKKFLTNCGGKVVIANNGIEALELLELQEVDIILMDIFMPEMGGVETTERIRNQSKYDAIPILAMTANVIDQDMENYLAVGMNSYISKPFDTSVMLEKIQSLLA